jgi:PKD repeat protein
MTNKNSTVLFLILLIVLIFFVTSCYKEELTKLVSDFDVTVVNNNYSVPVEISLANNSAGADRYLWTFKGGTPETSTLKQPESVVYRQAGTYQIQLECWFKDRSETKTYTLQLDSAIQAGFNIQMIENAFAPVELKVENLSSGATFYQWSFDGGSPAISLGKQPPLILYKQPGEYTVRLKAGNDRIEKEITKTFRVLPAMEADFTFTFAFEDEDRQAPATLYLESQTTSVLQYHWEAIGGTIANDAAQNASVYFANQGTYTITLQTDNGKETRKISKDVELLPNTNLLIMKDVRLGVNSSKEDGQFFSGCLRRTFLADNIDDSIGKLIDFAFFAWDYRFNYCRFLSPDSVQNFTFYPIHGATKTYIVNDMAQANLNFSLATFDAMQNDAPLASLNIKSKDTGDLYFGIDQLPRLVLFETSDGRKGAVKIKEKTDVGRNSYITVDVKMQKD